jgi:predicted nucleotidyltransferase component of viral defense system
MHEALKSMLDKYRCQSMNDYTNALREILQEIALLGLWRGKFFEKAAFYGGTSLRILYGLDRFSEDMDFSLLNPSEEFDLTGYGEYIIRETEAFGFDLKFDKVEKAYETPVMSAFLKADTRKQMMLFETGEEILNAVPKGKILKIKIEIDTDPPAGFKTETRYLLQPIPFAVRVYTLPDLFAGKMHAVLFRNWESRVKGRDWYDLVWYAASHSELHLKHLEARMVQTGDWEEGKKLTENIFKNLLIDRINSIRIDEVRNEVEPFVKQPDNLSIWSKAFFLSLVQRIKIIG